MFEVAGLLQACVPRDVETSPGKPLMFDSVRVSAGRLVDRAARTDHTAGESVGRRTYGSTHAQTC